MGSRGWAGGQMVASARAGFGSSKAAGTGTVQAGRQGGKVQCRQAGRQKCTAATSAHSGGRQAAALAAADEQYKGGLTTERSGSGWNGEPLSNSNSASKKSFATRATSHSPPTLPYMTPSMNPVQNRFSSGLACRISSSVKPISCMYRSPCFSVEARPALQ